MSFFRKYVFFFFLIESSFPSSNEADHPEESEASLTVADGSCFGRWRLLHAVIHRKKLFLILNEEKQILN